MHPRRGRERFLSYSNVRQANSILTDRGNCLFADRTCPVEHTSWPFMDPSTRTPAGLRGLSPRPTANVVGCTHGWRLPRRGGWPPTRRHFAGDRPVISNLVRRREWPPGSVWGARYPAGLQCRRRNNKPQKHHLGAPGSSSRTYTHAPALLPDYDGPAVRPSWAAEALAAPLDRLRCRYCHGAMRVDSGGSVGSRPSKHNANRHPGSVLPPDVLAAVKTLVGRPPVLVFCRAGALLVRGGRRRLTSPTS